MEIRVRDTGQVMFESEWLRLHPNTSFTLPLTVEVINDFGADPVLEGPQAQPGRYQVAFRDGIEQDAEGRWFTKYSVADMDAEAIVAKDAEQAKSVRTDRNKRLADCDWTQGKDIADNISTAWAAYRQALRDVPAQTGFPWDIAWPVQP